MSNKIILFGSAANPVHIGHVHIFDMLCYYGSPWFVPCYAHSFNKKMISPEHRLAMARLVFGPEAVFDYEITNKVTLCTYDLLCYCRDKFPDKEFSFAIGQDNADQIDDWRHWQNLIEEFPFYVFPREGQSHDDLAWYKEPPHTYLSSFVLRNVSSTQIRKNVEANKHFLTHGVYQYIKKNHLYEV